jgi:hypothetical protein
VDRWTTYREPPSQEIWPERLPVGRHRSLVLFPHMPAHSDPSQRSNALSFSEIPVEYLVVGFFCFLHL